MWHRLTQLLAALFRRRTIEMELDDELRDHLERDIAWRIRSGADPAEARRAALADLGGLERTRDEVRDAHGITFLHDGLRDIRFALRRVRRNPGYAALVVCTLGLGIGAATAVFSAVDGVLLKPLPFRDPHALITLWQTRPAEGNSLDDFAPGTFLDLRERVAAQVSLVGANPYGVNVRSDASTEQLAAWQLSEGFLDIVGVSPILGRGLAAEDYGPGAASRSPTMAGPNRSWS